MGRSLLRLTGVVVVVAMLVGGAVLAWRVLEPPTMVATERCVVTSDGSEHSFAPDQSANAALIAALARTRGLPPRAVTIALATAVQESKLRSIAYGDRDSLGLFQQRPSQGWGSQEQVLDPVYATNTFYDRLVTVEGYEDLPVTEAAQEVQRSGFPRAYADHEPEGRAWASALTGFSPASLTCRLRDPGPAQVERQLPGPDGLWPRAEVVRARALVELPDVSVATGPAGEDGGDGAGTDGRVLVMGAAGEGPDAVREAWANAAWAVAHADDLAVVEVATDGLTWRRSRPDDGWAPTAQAREAGAALAEPAAGTVAVRVAG